MTLQQDCIDVNRTVANHIAIGVSGLSFGSIALHMLSTRGLTVGWFALAGGSVLFIVQTVYLSVFTDSWASDPGRTTWAVVLAAILSLSGALLVLVP